MSEQKHEQDKDFLFRFAQGIGVVCKFVFGLIAKGVSRQESWAWARLKRWFVYAVVLGAIIFSPGRDLPYVIDHLSWIFPTGLGEWIYFHLSPLAQFILLVVVPFVGSFAVIGAIIGIRLARYQRGLDHLGIRTSTDIKPTVVDSIKTGDHQKKLIVQAIGIDVETFKNRKGALEAGFGAIVEDVRVSERNRQLVEILIAEKALPTLIRYDIEAMRHLIKPYTFMVGESLGGFIIGNLLEIHHMIVAGATGGGKSYFFKQVFIGLAESSTRIQFYLIDLKRGVEVKIFEKLGNVKIAKESHEAVAILTAIVAEMERRFKFLEEKGFTEIDPERDQMDRIVIGIDEASVLFTVERSSRSTNAAAHSARDLTDRIAKLGRAAAIHLILATQKVVKETIDTRVQTNINARMVFRVNTVASSMTVLGTKMAADLPEIKGRAVWSVGSKDIIVQAPRLTQEESEERMELLIEKFGGKEKAHFGPMLEIKVVQQSAKTGFTRGISKKALNPSSEANTDAG